MVQKLPKQQTSLFGPKGKKTLLIKTKNGPKLTKTANKPFWSKGQKKPLPRSGPWKKRKKESLFLHSDVNHTVWSQYKIIPYDLKFTGTKAETDAYFVYALLCVLSCFQQFLHIGNRRSFQELVYFSPEMWDIRTMKEQLLHLVTKTIVGGSV